MGIACLHCKVDEGPFWNLCTRAHCSLATSLEAAMTWNRYDGYQYQQLQQQQQRATLVVCFQPVLQKIATQFTDWLPRTPAIKPQNQAGGTSRHNETFVR